PRHRPDVRERALRRRREQRHAALRRLQPEQAGEGARDADRARAVGADREAAHADRFGRHAAARRAARGAAELPRIVGGAEQPRIGDALPAIFRRGRLAEQHGARLAQALRHRRVDGPRAVLVGREAAHARRLALGQHQVLDGDRHAVEIAEPLAALLPALLRGPRGTQRAVGIEMLEGVELGIEGLDAGDRRLRRLDRRGLARLVELGELPGGHQGEIGGHRLVSGRTGKESGWASAYAPASASTWASLKWPATICRPTGRPWLLRPHGTVAAGWRVRLKVAV